MSNLRYEIARTVSRIDSAAVAAERIRAPHWVDELVEWRAAIEGVRERWQRGTATEDEVRTRLAGARALIDHINEALEL